MICNCHLLYKNFACNNYCLQIWRITWYTVSFSGSTLSWSICGLWFFSSPAALRCKWANLQLLICSHVTVFKWSSDQKVGLLFHDDLMGTKSLWAAWQWAFNRKSSAIEQLKCFYAVVSCRHIDKFHHVMYCPTMEVFL